MRVFSRMNWIEKQEIGKRARWLFMLSLLLNAALCTIFNGVCYLHPRMVISWTCGQSHSSGG